MTQYEKAMQMILDERARQLGLGYTPQNDSKHKEHELILAASCYEQIPALRDSDPPCFWPFEAHTWKPAEDMDKAGRLRDLTKAGALYQAEIERMDYVKYEGKLREAVTEKIKWIAGKMAILMKSIEIDNKYEHERQDSGA